MCIALALSRPPCRERNAVLYAHPGTCSASLVSRALCVSWRPGCFRTRRRWSYKCSNVQNCAVAAPERHHTLYKSELGYRTDFVEQYSLREVIGKGNFGTVWLAASRHDPSQHVAVKIVPKSRNDRTHEETLDCIRREVAMWGSLSGDSRYVAQLLGLYEDGGSVYLVQQLCMGGDLSTALKDGPLSEACCAAVMWCVLSAIRDCHAHHLALIDVKPQNFLLTASASAAVPGGSAVSHLRLEDQVLLGPGGPCVVACDFGCSLSYSELMRGAKRAGSPVFFAPEQFTSSYGLGVDVWAAGVMLYLLLSGRYPFWDRKRDELETKLPAYQVMLAVCSAPITFDGPEWRGISRDARDLVSLMLDRNPTTRITAEHTLQHPWFARWMRVGTGAGAAVKLGAAAGPGKGLATGRRTEQERGQEAHRSSGSGSRGSSQQGTPLRERHLEHPVAVPAVTAPAGFHEASGGFEPGAARGEVPLSCCGGGNIVPLPAPLVPQLSLADHSRFAATVPVTAAAADKAVVAAAASSGCEGFTRLATVQQITNSGPAASHGGGIFAGDGDGEISAHSVDGSGACSVPQYH